MSERKGSRDAERRILPMVGDAVVLEGDKFRIRELVHRPTYHGDDVIAELIVAPAGPNWRASKATSHRELRLRWDARPAVWRPAPAAEPEQLA